MTSPERGDLGQAFVVIGNVLGDILKLLCLNTEHPIFCEPVNTRSLQ